MKKNLIVGLLAIAGLFAVSCQQDLSLEGTTIGESIVTFNVGTPQIELKSYSYSDGATATQLQYAVYAEDGTYLETLTGSATINGSATVKLPLVTGNKYSVIFWADHQDAPYELDFGAKTMTVDYNGVLSNNEKLDAFYKYHTFTVNGAQTESIELTRPFAQLNIGTNDFVAAAASGYVPTHSSVTIKKLQNTLNFADGTVAGEEEAVTFASAVIPSGETFPVAGYEYLAMNYFLVGADKEVVDVEFTFTNGTEQKTRTVGSVPVQRNYRTNIYGQLITSDVDVDVEINPDYNKPDNNEQTGVKIGNTLYNTLAKAYEAAQDGDELVVVGGIVLTEKFVIEKNITLNLNGNEITTTYDGVAKKHLYAFEVKADAAMVIKNGTIKARGIYNYGTLTLEAGAVIDACDGNGGYGIYNAGTFVMNGGEVKATNEDDHQVNNGGYDATPIYSSGTTTINSGVVNNICDYTFALDIQGGSVTVNGGKFTSIHSTISNRGNLTINGGEFVCNGLEGVTAHALVVWGGSTTTINGGTFDGKDNYNGFNVDAVAGATVYIKGGEFKPVHSGSLYGEGTIVVSGGEFFDKIEDSRLADDCSIMQLEDGYWKVEHKGWWQDANGNYHIEGVKGWLWMADQNDTFFGSRTIYLENDIDFSGVDMRVTRMWTPEYSATFDGQNHTISNVWMASGYSSNNQALFDGLMSVKNLTVTNTHVYGMSQVGIIGANIYGTIENCHIKDCRSYGYVHHVGGIVGLHSWGEIKNCSVEKTSIECYYYGAVGAIAGAMNEVSRKVLDCSVKDSRLIKEGPEGVYPDWDPLFGIVVGYAYAVGNYVFDCDIENTTIKGEASTQVFGELPGGSSFSIPL